MHFPLLTLTSIPFLLPHLTTTTPTTTLSKRFHYGYVGSYATNDLTCSRGWDRSQPHVNDPTMRPETKQNVCTPFTPHSDNIGINYGTGLHEFVYLTFYTDGDCQQLSSIGSVQSANGFGAGANCIHPSSYGGNNTVGSVMATTEDASGNGQR